jgi:hypothetical protein
MTARTSTRPSPSRPSPDHAAPVAHDPEQPADPTDPDALPVEDPDDDSEGDDDAADADDDAGDQDGEIGQATTEYALVLLGAALVALLLIGWATAGGGAGKIGHLLDHVLDAITSKI